MLNMNDGTPPEKECGWREPELPQRGGGGESEKVLGSRRNEGRWFQEEGRWKLFCPVNKETNNAARIFQVFEFKY